MAITIANLTSGGSATDANSYTTASVAPGANKLEILSVATEIGGVEPTIAGNGITWLRVCSAIQNSHRVTVFVGTAASPSSGTIVITVTGATGAEWCLDEVSGSVVTAGGLDGIVQAVMTRSFGTAGTTATSTTMQAFEASGNAVYAVTLHAANEATTPKTNYTETSDQAHASPSVAFETQYRIVSSDTAPSATWTTSSNWCMIALELRVSGQAVPTIQCRQMYEDDDNVDATAFTSAFPVPSPVAGRLYLCAVHNTKATTPDTPTVTGANMTWTQVDTVLRAGVSRITWFMATGTAPSSQALTVDFAGATQTSYFITVLEFRGPETGQGANAAQGVAQDVTGNGAAEASQAITLGTFAHAKNACAGAWGNATSQVRGDDDAGNILMSESSHASPTASMQTFFNPTTDTGHTFTLRSGTDGLLGIVVEVRALITQQAALVQVT